MVANTRYGLFNFPLVMERRRQTPTPEKLQYVDQQWPNQGHQGITPEGICQVKELYVFIIIITFPALELKKLNPNKFLRDVVRGYKIPFFEELTVQMCCP
ncbi:hypothetical protein TSAR_006228 [Trichomalopsis sarcophagae]|uniref:Uncharacterized protein n=1 Tax=Trichomalopsis sarcophagae TaxID=543379 RepID=A0A232EJB4_9HYME|nr:hypothetical protein TSAR_006228 [Trichomalopsis sarcophagae]